MMHVSLSVAAPARGQWMEGHVRGVHVRRQATRVCDRLTVCVRARARERCAPEVPRRLLPDVLFTHT